MSSDLVLGVRNVSKVYRVYSRPQQRLWQALDDKRGKGPRHCFEVPAVSEVSFDLNRGESISIVGRNGSGKSTLLEMVVGTLTPTKGTIVRKGRVSALLELGAGFNPDFSGRQNFRLAAAIQGLSEAEIDKIEPEVEEFAEIGPFIDEPVRTYSSGMYVRLAFASAVHVFPDLLIVDEALAVGDIFFQQKCFAFMEQRLAETSKVIVTHDLPSAVRLSTRCLVMDRGRVVFDGPPLEAVEAYTALNLRERSTRTGSAGVPLKAANAPPKPSESELNEIQDPFTDAESLEVDRSRSSDPDAFSVNRMLASRQSGRGLWEPMDGDWVTLRTGDQVRIALDVTIGRPINQPIWGYFMRDRVGNTLFGQNTVGSSIDAGPIEAGRHVITFEFLWPEVEQGEYTLTFGLGDGAHPLHHSIVAWVQGLLRIVGVPLRPVHGAFNNDLLTLTVQPLPDHDPAIRTIGPST